MKKYYVNKDFILGSISRKEMTISNFCKEINIERSNFYVALNKSYHAPRSRTITKVMIKLDLPESLVWREEE